MEDKKHAGGRPPLFKDASELEKRIEDYFQKCQPEILKDQNGDMIISKSGLPAVKLNPPTITGLALYLGFCSRQSIYDYENRNDEFSYIIKRARLMCENFIEENAYSGNIPPAPAIFALKNYGWKDTQDWNLGGGMNLNIVIKGE